MIAPAAEPRGTVIRSMREGDTVVLEIDGVEIGRVEIVGVPHDSKIRVAFSFVRRVRISHAKANPTT